MITIRLTRNGVKKKPFFRIIAIEKKSKREGRLLDIIGYWFPKGGKKVDFKSDFIKIDKERLDYWRKVGAKETQTVKSLISQNNKQ